MRRMGAWARNGTRRLTKVSPSATPTGHAASRLGSVLVFEACGRPLGRKGFLSRAMTAHWPSSGP
jgi:hypothetical protein